MAQANQEAVNEALGPLSQLSTGFSDAFAQPLKAAIPKNYQPGYAGSPRAFFNLLINNPTELESCSSRVLGTQDGTACAYAAFLTGCLIIGIVIPSITFLYCCGFACARSFTDRCHCCGAMCKQPNCGGKKPTSDYKKKDMMCCGCTVVFLVVCVLTLGIIGFLSTNQMAVDMQEVITAMDATTAFPAILSAQINDTLVGLKTDADKMVVTINEQLGGREIVNTRVRELNTSVAQLQSRFRDIRTFVEGRRTNGGSNPCSWVYNGTSVTFNAKSNAWQSSVAEFPGIRCCVDGLSENCVVGSHGIGQGSAVPPGGSAAKTCTDFSISGSTITQVAKECPCCCTCVESVGNLDNVLVMMPSDAELEQLNRPMNVSGFGDTITQAEADVEVAIHQFDESFSLLSEALKPAKDALGDQAAVIGGAVSIWAFAWIAAIFALLGLVFARNWCWWTSYCMGVVIVILFFVLFGVSSLIVLPFGDICDGMPLTGETPTNWLLTFSTSQRIEDVDPILANLYTDCLVLTNKDGRLWSVAGLTRDALNQKFSDFNVSELIPEATVAKNLDSDSNTASFSQNKRKFNSFSADNASLGYDASVVTSLQAVGTAEADAIVSELTDYRTELARLIALMKTGVTDVETKQASLKSASDTLSNNITVMKQDSETTIYNITTDMYESGNCSYLNTLYVGVRSPMCSKLTKSLDAMWVLFFLMGIFWFPMFIAICRGSKHSMQRRGVLKVEDDIAEQEKKAVEKKKKKYVVEDHKDGAGGGGGGGGGDGGGGGGGGDKKEKKKKKKEKDGGGDDGGGEKKKKKKKKKKEGDDGGGGGGGDGGGDDAALARKKAAK